MMITSQTRSGWEKPAKRDQQRDSRWDNLTPTNQQVGVAHGKADHYDLQESGGWDTVATKDLGCTQLHSPATQADVAPDLLPWGDAVPTDQQAQTQWDQTIKPKDPQALESYLMVTPTKDHQRVSGFYRSAENSNRPDSEAARLASLYRPNWGQPLNFSFGSTPYYPNQTAALFFEFRYVPENRGIMPTDQSTDRIPWGDAIRLNQSAALLWGKATQTDGTLTKVYYATYEGGVVVIPDPPVSPEILEAYMIGNLVTVKETVSNTPVMATNLSLSFNADSFSWALTMDVLGRSSLNLIRPDTGGQKMVEVNINGHVWVFLVEKYRRNFKFAEEAYSITGSSRTQLLTEPYAPKISGSNVLDKTAHQLMDDLVTYTGFTINWSTTETGDVPDWTIPAGAFSYKDQTPMQLIIKIASSIGAITRPGMATDTITIVPRYFMPVWEWNTAVVHKILPAALITNLGGDWSPKPSYDCCYVSGVSFGVGVLATRTGKAGVIPAPDVFDDLMTDSTANTYRAKVEICKGGDQELVTVQLPLFGPAEAGTPGLILPGHLCNVQETDVSWVGLCLDTTINASGVGASVVTQTVKLERHTSEL